MLNMDRALAAEAGLTPEETDPIFPKRRDGVDQES
jgi:hypothetical protein